MEEDHVAGTLPRRVVARARTRLAMWQELGLLRQPDSVSGVAGGVRVSVVGALPS